MPTTLTKDAETIQLPSDLLWADEFAFSQVAASTGYGMDGTLIVDEVPRLSGRPITLEGGDSHGWITRATLQALEAWRALPGQQFTLNYRGDDYSVVMDHARDAIAARPVVDYSNPSADAYYVVVLRFLSL